jgi:predicted dehydrogenase
MKTWKIAIAGAGRAGEELAVLGIINGKKYTNLNNVQIVSIADIDIDKANLIANRYNIPNYYSDIIKMLDTEKPDILIITTPLNFHYEHAMCAIERNINIILEKPATETPSQLDDIVSSLKKYGVKGIVSHNYKFLNGFRNALSMYKDGILGDIIHIDRVWMTPAHEDRMEREDNWWHHIPGGRMADGLPHHLYVCYPFVGEMCLQNVSIKKMSADREWSLCDEANISLSTAKGYVNIRMSTNQELWSDGKGSSTYYATLYGTKRNALIYQTEANILSPRFRDKLRLVKSSFTKSILPSLSMGNSLIKNDIAIRGGHNIMFNRFIKYLSGEIENPVPWDEAKHVMKLTYDISNAMQTEINKLP